MLPIFVILYLALALLVSFEARGSRVGFWGALVLSLVLTPFVTFGLRHLLADRGGGKTS